MSERHCPCGRRAPVQGSSTRGAGTIAWEEHEEAWAAYATHHGRDPSAERIAERGGFGWNELCQLLGREPKTWAVRGAVAEREHPR